MKSLSYIAVLFFLCFAGCESKPAVVQKAKTVAEKSKATTDKSKIPVEKSKTVRQPKTVGKLPLTEVVGKKDSEAEKTKPRSVSVLVFRHHPGIIMPEGQMQGKIDDEKLIMQTMKERTRVAIFRVAPVSLSSLPPASPLRIGSGLIGRG